MLGANEIFGQSPEMLTDGAVALRYQAISALGTKHDFIVRRRCFLAVRAKTGVEFGGRSFSGTCVEILIVAARESGSVRLVVG